MTPPQNRSSRKQPKWIAIDFDGVLAQYTGFKGRDVLGKPMKGAASATRSLKNAGWNILVYTTRPATPKLKRWLKRHRIVHDCVNTTRMNPRGTSLKPCVDIWLDDRAICFKGNWTTALRSIQTFQPAYRRSKASKTRV